MIDQVFKKYISGNLVSLKRKEHDDGPDCKPGNFQDWVKIEDEGCKETMLQELLSGKKTFKEFSDESKLIKRRQNVQKQFLRDTECRSWEEAEQRYPLHTTVEALDRFGGINFQRGTHQVWSDHVTAAKLYSKSKGMMIFKT